MKILKKSYIGFLIIFIITIVDPMLVDPILVFCLEGPGHKRKQQFLFNDCSP